MKMLNDMLHLCRCSFLFCTATQPDFQKRKDFCGIDHILPLVENPASIFASTKRVKYNAVDDYKPQSFESIADCVVKQKDSVLIVCNTKKKAMALFECLKNRSEIPVLHLSTNMCQIHRMEVINKVRQMLRNGDKLILCSTQLIEAGVDIDFPVVFRELAPLESIIQSAGRCNREGLLKEGWVYLFQFEDQSQPTRQYETFSQYAQLHYKGNESRLTGADFYSEYYKKIISLYVEKDSITSKRKKMMFQDVAGLYHIINSNTTSLFISGYDDESKRLYTEIKDKEYLSRKDYQRIAQYSVQVLNKSEKKPSNGIEIWFGAYSKDTGLSNEDEIYYI